MARSVAICHSCIFAQILVSMLVPLQQETPNFPNLRRNISRKAYELYVSNNLRAGSVLVKLG